jgi:cyclic pyranopterin monophosphate synthase
VGEGEGEDRMGNEGGPGDGTFDDGTRTGRRRTAHVERIGRPRMTDITDQPMLARRAVAEAEVSVSQETLSAIVDGTNPKGDVLSVAELAGVMGGKRTSDLIPLSHPVGLTDLLVRAVPDRAGSLVRIRVETAAIGPGGVEMEALTAAAVAALAVYDMVRAIDPSVAIRGIKLISHSGGEGGAWQRPEQPYYSTPHAPRGARVAGRIAGSPYRGGPPGRGAPRKHG